MPVTRPSARDARMDAGIEVLDRWLEDLARAGVAAMAEAGVEGTAALSARLVDAQAPGLAARVRRVGTASSLGPRGVEGLLDELGVLALLTEAWRGRRSLPEPLRLELMLALGATLRREEVSAAGERVVDDWWVVGERVEAEERLLVRRSWLVGRESGRYAMVQDVAIPRVRDFALSLPVGARLEGELVFYPGVARQRALILAVEEPPRPFVCAPPAAPRVREVQERLAALLAVCPWAMVVGAVVGPLRVGRVRDDARGERALLVDSLGDALPLAGPAAWSLLALAGPAAATDAGLRWTGPVSLAIEWDGRVAVPLTAFDEDGVHPLSGLE